MLDTRPLLRDVLPEALAPLLVQLGEPAWRGRQLSAWLHRSRALQWEAMTDLPRALRLRLADAYDLQGLKALERRISTDGTRKHLFELRDGATIESVIIPMEGHFTFCLSSQVGCAMACRFCATARGGLARGLSMGEILEQVVHLERDLAADPPTTRGQRAGNLVFMGMGEPLDNWEGLAGSIATLTAAAGGGISHRRITISTSGPREGLRRLMRLPQSVGLTLSVNAASPELRRRLMPIPGRTPLPVLLRFGERWARRIHRKTTLGYVLIAGVNDDLAEARLLARLAAGRPFKVNLIPLNRFDDDGLAPPGVDRVLAFQQVLLQSGVQTFIRASGGQDIDAACGQLRRRRLGSRSGRLA
mgnify:FL=1